MGRIMPTAEYLVDVQAGILLFEVFPCADDTIGGIDKSTVHVKEAAYAQRRYQVSSNDKRQLT